MGKEIRGVPEGSALTATAGGADREASIGRFLAAQRRLRGVSLDELADLTRIPRRSLERLEDGAFDRQADGFARGFVRTVALALGLDADQAVMRLLVEPADADEDLGSPWLPLQRWATGTLALLVGVAVLVGAWSLWQKDAPAPVASDEIVLRRDPVRALAAREHALGTAAEPLDSPREGNPD